MGGGGLKIGLEGRQARWPQRRRVEPGLVIIQAQLGEPSLTGILEPADIARTGNAVFILATAAIDRQAWADALYLGAYDVVVKPFQIEEVLHVIRTTYLSSRRLAAAACAAG